MRCHLKQSLPFLASYLQRWLSVVWGLVPASACTVRHNGIVRQTARWSGLASFPCPKAVPLRESPARWGDHKVNHVATLAPLPNYVAGSGFRCVCLISAWRDVVNTPNEWLCRCICLISYPVAWPPVMEIWAQLLKTNSVGGEQSQ